MWRRLYTRRGQSTGEYALVFAIILGAIVAMQTYVKREIQGRVKDGADLMTRETKSLGSTSQYEPYYYKSDYTTARGSTRTQGYTDGATATTSKEDSARAADGYTEYSEAEDQTAAE